MQILIVSPFFAPENQIASHRMTKFAENWASKGHSVSVLTREPAFGGMEILGSGLATVYRVRDPLARFAQSGLKRVRAARHDSPDHNFLKIVQKIVKFLLFPDHYLLWSILARKKVVSIQAKPDVVVTSVGPISALIVGGFAATHFNVPLVIDYRDLLTDQYTTQFSQWSIRGRLVTKLERHYVSLAALLTAVTQPMCDILGEKFRKPTLLVTNGFEPSDFSGLEHEPDPDRIHIAYVGTIYPGHRDPSLLFEAVSALSSTTPFPPFALDFYGKASPEVQRAAESLGIEKVVVFHGEVTHAEALRVQVNADVLLLLFRNHPDEQSVYTGKLFEYIGAGRPILCIGLQEGVGPDLIREHGLGVVLNTTDDICHFLRGVLLERQRKGEVEGPRPGSLEKFTRNFQSGVMLQGLKALSHS